MVRTAAFSPDGARLATGCNDGSVWVWNAADATVLGRYPVDSWVPHVEFAPGGEHLLVARAHRPALLLSLEDGSSRSLDLVAYHATFTPDARILLACRDGRVALETREGQLALEFPAHEAAVTRAEMSPDCRRIVTGSDDGTARLWQADGTLEATLRGHLGSVEYALFSPSGDRVLTSSGDGTARIWMADPESLLKLADERATRDFSPAEIRKYQELLDLPDSR
jgi:WD40 repeat protein